MHETGAKITITASAALAALVALAGCAGSGERPSDRGAMRTSSVGTDCFTVSLADDFRYLDDRNLIVYAGARQAYHVELAQTCFGLRSQTRLALRSRTDRMCGFAGDAVIVDGPFTERCSVLSVRRLDRGEVEALIAQFEDGVTPGRPTEGFEVEVVEVPDEEAGGDGGAASGDEGGSD